MSDHVPIKCSVCGDEWNEYRCIKCHQFSLEPLCPECTANRKKIIKWLQGNEPVSTLIED